MRQFIPDAPLRQATPQHHREQKPHHAQAGKVLQATLLLLPLRTVLHTREQQLARIHLLYHAQAYPLAHLVSLLAVAYSIPIGMFLSALLHGLTLSVVCQKGYPFVCSGSPFLLFDMAGALCLSCWQREPVGTSWSNKVASQRGQAPGPLIHPTPPLVPTGPWDA